MKEILPYPQVSKHLEFVARGGHGAGCISRIREALGRFMTTGSQSGTRRDVSSFIPKVTAVAAGGV